MIWKNDMDNGVNWTSATVGEIEMVPGSDLAKMRSEYKDLAKIDTEIPPIVLNRTFSPLKSYVHARAAELTEEGKKQARERYAVGVGVALLVLKRDADKAAKAGTSLDEATTQRGAEAAARGVLSVLPEYDRLAKALDD